MAMGQSPTKNFSAVAYDEAGNKRKIALITGVTGQVSREKRERKKFGSFCFFVIATNDGDDDASHFVQLLRSPFACFPPLRLPDFYL